MIHIEGIDQHRTGKATQHLGHHIGQHRAPGEFTRKGQAHRNGRIQVCTRIRARNEHTAHDGKAPGQGNDDPAGALRLGFVQRNGGADAVSHQHEHHGAQKLKHTFVEKGQFHIVIGYSLPFVRWHRPNPRTGWKPAAGLPAARKPSPPATGL